MTVGAYDTPAAALAKARALIELRRYAEAASVLAPLSASQPDDPEVWCLLAAAQLGGGHPAEALTSAQRASGLTPEADWPHRLRSRAFWQLTRYKEAADAARMAVALAPDEPAGYVQLAQSLSQIRGGLFEASAAAHRALALDPGDPSSHFVLGVVEAAAGHRDEAARAFRRTLEIDPNYTAAMNELARLELKRPVQRMAPTRLAETAAGFATAVRTDPRAQTSRYNLDLTLRRFLGLASYLIFLVALLAAYWGPSSASPLHRAAPLGLLIPVLFAARFLARLPRELRRHLGQLLGSGLLRIVAITEVLAAVALVLTSVTVAGPRYALLGFAVCAAFAARVALLAETVWFGGRRSRRGWRPRTMRQFLGLAFLLLVLARFALLVVFSPPMRHWLDIGSQLPDCGQAGISIAAAREGSCVRNIGLFGQGTTYTVVDRAHTLHMPGYTARLIGERINETRVDGPEVNATDYPNDTGLVVSFKLAITDTASTPLSFDTMGSDTDLLFPNLSGSDNGVDELVNGYNQMSPTFIGRLPLPPHKTVVGWVNFTTPLWANRTLNARPADLELYLPGQSQSDFVGQIRLWR